MTDELSRFLSLIRDAASTGTLSRLTFSRPAAKNGENTAIKVTAALFLASDGAVMVKTESIMADGKSIRKNYTVDESFPL